MLIESLEIKPHSSFTSPGGISRPARPLRVSYITARMLRRPACLSYRGVVLSTGIIRNNEVFVVSPLPANTVYFMFVVYICLQGQRKIMSTTHF